MSYASHITVILARTVVHPYDRAKIFAGPAASTQVTGRVLG